MSGCQENFVEKSLKLAMYSKSCILRGCNRLARANSKYCSEECGLKLADVRVRSFMPLFVAEQQFGSPAEERDQRALQNIQVQKKQILLKIRSIDDRTFQLKELIERAKRVTIDPNWEWGEKQYENFFITCVNCATEINMAQICGPKHLEKCFRKCETLTSLSGFAKSHPFYGDVLCDTLDPVNGLYCKRLKVICAEHTKETKPKDTDACGAPLPRDPGKKGRSFCRMPKKDCPRHYEWERLQRASTDLERFNELQKLDKLIKSENSILHGMQKRGGILATMLHRTLHHDNVEDSS